MLIGLTIVLCLFFWFRHKNRNDMQTTIRTALEKGQELSPEIIDRLGTPKPPKDKDLRIALIWISLAIGLAVFGWAMQEEDEEVFRVFMGISAFPISLGIAYLLMWRFTEK
jgi:hypothetical protein